MCGVEYRKLYEIYLKLKVCLKKNVAFKLVQLYNELAYFFWILLQEVNAANYFDFLIFQCINYDSYWYILVSFEQLQSGCSIMKIGFVSQVWDLVG